MVANTTVNDHISTARRVCAFLHANHDVFGKEDYARYDAWLANMWNQVHNAPLAFGPRPKRIVQATAKDLFRMQVGVEDTAQAALRDDPDMLLVETKTAVRYVLP